MMIHDYAPPTSSPDDCHPYHKPKLSDTYYDAGREKTRPPRLATVISKQSLICQVYAVDLY